MLVPPLDTKGKVTPVNGSRSTEPKTFNIVWKTNMLIAPQAAMVKYVDRPAIMDCTAKTARVTMESTASTAIISPHSSMSIPNTISVSAAGTL